MKAYTGNIAILETAGFTPTAKLRHRSAKEIGESPWSIGMETIDRDYVDFDQVSPYLEELGATQTRLQAGWAKCDLGDGFYNWGWLDHIINTCLEKGVKPWLQTSYGNPAYPGGGGVGLAQSYPKSPEALAAWDRWIQALGERYSDRVNTWEIWNEPDHDIDKLKEYADLFIRTMSILRSTNPNARSVGLVLGAEWNLIFAENFLRYLKTEGKTELLNELGFHFYPHNPDNYFRFVEKLKEMLATYAPHATLRQGETGSPSEELGILVMGKFHWNERKQAAWNLRRLLAHHSRGIPMNLFQLADMWYEKKDGALFVGKNPKGQLCINPDKTVAYRKPSFFMAQHVFSVFDNRFPLMELENLGKNAKLLSYAHAWTPIGADKPSLVAWWQADEPPTCGMPEIREISLAPQPFKHPVLIDFLSGIVFEPPKNDGMFWKKLPHLDVPLAMAECDSLHLSSLSNN